MPVAKMTIKPGVNSQATHRQGESQWVDADKIRFKDGFMQKLGGYARIYAGNVVGTPRGMVCWADFNYNKYIAIGTSERLYVYNEGGIYDITPIKNTSNITNAFTTTSGSKVVTINDPSYSPQEGDWINIFNPMYVNGIKLYGFYKVKSVGPSTYTIEAATNATSSGTGGTAVKFDTTSGSSTVTVTYNSHGFSAGNTYTVKILTNVGGLGLLGDYTVATVINANSFTINAGSNASSTDSKYENDNKARIKNLLNIGGDTLTYGIGYGEGVYGLGYYSYGVGEYSISVRQWSFGQWGEDIVACPVGSTIYHWDVTNGLTDNPAVAITNAPEIITGGILVSNSQQQIIALGASVSSTPDPLLIRWCDVADFNDWTATSTNQAGSFRITTGSKIVGGICASQNILVFTDTSVWTMQYIGMPYVYGFNHIASGCGLIAMRACGILGETVMWMSFSNFYTFGGGGVSVIPCSVWDKVFNKLNRLQADKIFFASNDVYDEATWFYPSLDGDGEVDRYVTLHKGSGLWSCGSLNRTCFFGSSAFGYPVACDSSGNIYQHETGEDADTSAMVSWARTGWFSIENGDVFIFLERALPDLKAITGNPTLKMYVYSSKYGTDDDENIVTYGPFYITNKTEYVRVRARGRFLSVKIVSEDKGTSWRLGEIRFFVQADGKHG